MLALQEIRYKETGQVKVNEYETYFSGMVDKHSYGSSLLLYKNLWFHTSHIKDLLSIIIYSVVLLCVGEF